MKKIFTIISCFLFLSCCKNYLFKRDTVAIYNELTKINEQDQKVRKELTPIYYKYNLRTLQTVVDSIDKLGLDYFPENLNLNFENIDDQIKKLSVTEQKSFQKEHDDQWKKINHTDSINFEKIYNIVKKYGFIDFDTREWKNDSLKIGIISTTTHFNYRTKKGKKLLKLIISEY
ncbi:hypothetical protein [Flavobacterium sp. I3-2]|uniref:hypothetical protein n=1 Tax=Flavobacterium sp. I3-2 TaxID=2748319 RepID=UPI0015ABA3B7|nr:hypothetical protein [Flavobacterium sp. I3-2]